MDFSHMLQQLGLSEKESEVYTALLKMGQVSAGTLIRVSGCKRATVYSSLRTLEQKHLIASTEVDNVDMYEAFDPSIFLDQAQSYLQVVTGLVPQLQALKTQGVYQPKVRYLHGKKGIEMLFDAFAASQTKEMKVLIGNQLYYNDILLEVAKPYVEQRIASGTILKRLLTEQAAASEKLKKDADLLRSSKILIHFPIELGCDMNIFGPGQISFLFFDDKKAPHCILIESQKIWETCDALFDYIRQLV